MKYSFSDILSEQLYETARFIFITGSSYTFINMISDTAKYYCGKYGVNISATNSISNEFGIEDKGESNGNIVDFETFKTVVDTPNINGKWFCACDYKTLTKKQVGYLETYMRRPNDNGMLVVYSTDFMDFKRYMKSNALNYGRNAHIINTTFVHRNTLKEILRNMIAEKGRGIEPLALDYIIMKINRAYDETEDILNLVLEQSFSTTITLKEVKLITKKIENFTLDDFILTMIAGDTRAEVGNRKIYRMTVAMIDQYGYDKILRKLMREVNTYIEFRKYINKGTIPMGIRYFYSDVVKEIGKESHISTINEVRFRNKALIAAQTSLRDWVYMKLIIERNMGQHSEQATFKAMYELITRNVVSPSRINNAVGLEDIIQSSKTRLDKYKYIDRKEITGEIAGEVDRVMT